MKYIFTLVIILIVGFILAAIIVSHEIQPRGPQIDNAGSKANADVPFYPCAVNDKCA